MPSDIDEKAFYNQVLDAVSLHIPFEDQDVSMFKLTFPLCVGLKPSAL